MAFRSLVGAISEQRQEIKEALSSFAYFENWDPDVIGECCRLSSVAEFPPDKIILGPDNGNSHTVYFILEGICRMVQHMYVEVRSRPSQKVSGLYGESEILQYKRYRYSDSKTLHSESKNEGYKSRLLNMESMPTTNPEDGEGVVQCQPANSPEEELKESVLRTEDEEEALIEEGVNGNAPEFGNNGEEGNTEKCGNNVEEGNTENKPPEEEELELAEEETRIEGPEVKYGPECGNNGEEGNTEKCGNNGEEGNTEPPEEEELELAEEETKIEVPEVKYAPECGNNGEEGKTENNPPEEQEIELAKEETKIEVPEVKYEPDHHLKVLEECKKRRNELISDRQKGVLPEKSKNVRSVFIQTGFLLKGACFGLEKTENFIITSTKVKCLKIPQRFLLKHNPCNIWNRIRLFHALYLPKDSRIFQTFRSDRLWIEWKKKLSEEIASKKNIYNHTVDSDVPYSLRLVEGR